MVFSEKVLKLSIEAVTLSFWCNTNGFNNIFSNNKKKTFIKYALMFLIFILSELRKFHVLYNETPNTKYCGIFSE